MGRRAKSLLELVQDQTFLARKDHPLLGDGDLLPWKTLSRIQEQYRSTEHELERRRIALEFQNALPAFHARRQRNKKPLVEVLDGLGPQGSVERVVGLAHKFCRLENGKPFRLAPFQVDVLRRFLRRDRKGRRVFHVLLFGIARGNGKTPFGTLLDLDALVDGRMYDSENVFHVAGSLEQGRIAKEFAEGWIHDSELNEWVKVRSAIECPSNRGRLRILSSDGRLAHGRKFRRGSADELWLFSNYREIQSWVALESALHKDPEADLVGMTTAGYDMTSFLGEKYSDALELDHVEISNDGCLTIAEDPTNGFLMVWYGAPEDADIENPAIVRACNPLTTLDPRLILQELRRPGADELEWRRLHANQWTKVKNAWLPTGAWRSILTDGVTVPVGAEIYVAVDAAYSGDTTAVVFAWRAPDGRIHLRARIFSTSRKNPAHVYVDEPTLDNEQLVEGYIFNELAPRYKIREIVFDPEYFTNEAKHLARAGFTIAPLYPQSGDMSDAVRATRRMVLARELGADREDKPLTAHFESAESRKVIRGTKEFDAIQKPNRDTRIDGATAGVMAAWRCLVAEPNKPFVMVAGQKSKPIPTESGVRHAIPDLPWRPKKKRR